MAEPRRRWILIVAAFAVLAIAMLAWLDRATRGRSATKPLAADEQSRRREPAGDGSEDRTAAIDEAMRETERLETAGAHADPGDHHRTGGFDVRVHHTVDPCTTLLDPVIPPGFDTVTVQGVTVATKPFDPQLVTPLDVPARPVALAHAAAGILAEAAALTATQRRPQLAIIVDRSRDEYFAQTRAPPWSAGFYDGRVVRLPARHSTDLGVPISTLRHELMHAQLHAGVGCMPAWFNEGVAMYFGDSPPIGDWIEMLRERETFDLRPLQVRAIDEKLTREAASRAYARSLAMVVYLVEHGGEASIQNAITAVVASNDPAPRLAVWNRLYPNVDGRGVLETLAERVFAMPLGRDLDDALAGPVCCTGLRSVGELRCQAGAARPNERSWVVAAEGQAPMLACRTEW